MIFTLRTDINELGQVVDTYIIFKDTDKAWDAFNMVHNAFPDSGPFMACCGQYEKALWFIHN